MTNPESTCTMAVISDDAGNTDDAEITGAYSLNIIFFVWTSEATSLKYNFLMLTPENFSPAFGPETSHELAMTPQLSMKFEIKITSGDTLPDATGIGMQL